MAKFVIRKSTITGRGIFATEMIPRGKIIFIMKGRIIYSEVHTKRDAMLCPHRVGIGKNLWMEPDMKCVRYINHSCRPNAGIKGRVTFVALRDIKKGEEITFDYSISEDSEWTLRCSCGEENCRGIIRGIRYLPRKVFFSYLPFIPKYFQRVYYRASHLSPLGRIKVA